MSKQDMNTRAVRTLDQLPVDLTRCGNVVYPADFERPCAFLTIEEKKVVVSLAQFSQVIRYRDFCRVEAVVDVTFQLLPSLHPIQASVLTHVPIQSEIAPGELRRKLVRSAVTLALLMPELNSAEQQRRA